MGALPSFSLPVITTCPGKTPFCDRYCFGLWGWFSMVDMKRKNDERLAATLADGFVDTIIEEIRKTRAPAFRLHVIGDFYTVEYVEKWITIAKWLPYVIFFGSTRSWRCEFLAEALKQMRDLENVYLKASVDLTDSLDPFSCGWSVWSVEGEGILCPHDHKSVANCAECKRCWTIKDLNVNFSLRWGPKNEYRNRSLFSFERR